MIRALLDRIPDQEVEAHLLSAEGEHVVDLVRHHWIVFVLPTLELGLVLVLWAVAVFGPISAGWIFILLGLAVLVHAVFRLARERRDVFVITNMRVFRASGVLNVKIATMPITRILDITVDKPVVGRVLGYGHFVFESAAQAQGLRDIRFIPDPDARDLTIQRVVQRAGLRGPRGGAHLDGR